MKPPDCDAPPNARHVAQATSAVATGTGDKMSMFGQEYQPTCAQEAVAEDQGNASQNRERSQEIERAAGKDAALDLEALDEGAEHHSLRHGCDQRAVEEATIPEGLVLGIAKAELEGDAAKHQRQQHDQDRKIKRR